MKKLLVIVFCLFTTVLSAKEWAFELSPSQVKMVSSTKLERPKWFLDSCNLKNMVNLSFFTSKTWIGPYRDKRVLSPESPKKWPFLVIEKGEAHIYDPKTYGKNLNVKLIGVSADYMVAGYPILLQEGKRRKISKSFFSRRRCPRTAIGIHPNGSLILYVSTAATLKDVQTFFFNMGCSDAINFDGGSSTFLYLEGQKVYSSNQGRSYPNVLYWD